MNVVELCNRLRGGPCRPTTQDAGIAISARNTRRPGAGVECGRLHDSAFVANDCCLAIEALTPTTRSFDQFRMLEETKTVSTLARVLIDRNAWKPCSTHWAKPANARTCP